MASSDEPLSSLCFPMCTQIDFPRERDASPLFTHPTWMCMSLINANTLNGHSVLLPVWNPTTLTSFHSGLCLRWSCYLFAFREDRENQEIREMHKWVEVGTLQGRVTKQLAFLTTWETKHTISNEISKDTQMHGNAPSAPTGQFTTLSDHWTSSCRRASSISVSKCDSNLASHLPMKNSPCLSKL